MLPMPFGVAKGSHTKSLRGGGFAIVSLNFRLNSLTDVGNFLPLCFYRRGELRLVLRLAAACCLTSREGNANSDQERKFQHDYLHVSRNSLMAADRAENMRQSGISDKAEPSEPPTASRRGCWRADRAAALGPFHWRARSNTLKR